MPEATVSAPATILVIGYGSELRGDDAVGPRVAEAVAGWHQPGVRAVGVHQLAPELAEALASARFAIFVDASIDSVESGVQVREIGPAELQAGVGHTGDPRNLLALARALYGRYPRAWLVTVPVARFEFGAALSLEAERGRAEAVRRVVQLLRALAEGGNPRPE